MVNLQHPQAKNNTIGNQRLKYTRLPQRNENKTGTNHLNLLRSRMLQPNSKNRQTEILRLQHY